MGMYYLVSFESNGGSDVTPQRVKMDGVAARPANPTRNGYTFDGWYADAAAQRNAHCYACAHPGGATGGAAAHSLVQSVRRRERGRLVL